MSPINVASRMASRRTFSLLTRLCTIAPTMDHPFQRLPVSQTSFQTNYTPLIMNAGKRLVIFGGLFGAVMGWPLFAEKMLDGHV